MCIAVIPMHQILIWSHLILLSMFVVAASSAMLRQFLCHMKLIVLRNQLCDTDCNEKLLWLFTNGSTRMQCKQPSKIVWTTSVAFSNACYLTVGQITCYANEWTKTIVQPKVKNGIYLPSYIGSPYKYILNYFDCLWRFFHSPPYLQNERKQQHSM